MVQVYKGWKGKIMMGDTLTEVGDATSVTIDIDQDTDEYLAIGKLQPICIVPGSIHITGSIEKAWVDSSLVKLFGINGTGDASSVRFTVYAYEANASGPYVYIWNCYSEKVSISMPADDFMTNSIDFRGEYFTYGGT
jgi:hypothetical protein